MNKQEIEQAVLEEFALWLETRNNTARRVRKSRSRDDRILGRIEGEEAVVSIIRYWANARKKGLGLSI